MLEFKDQRIQYCYDECQQCGACVSVCPKGALGLKDLRNGLKKIIIDESKCIKCKRCLKVCPARRTMDEKCYDAVFKDFSYFLAHNDDDEIRRAQSSGGAAKTLVVEGLKAKIIDGAYALKRKDTFPFAEGEFYTSCNATYDSMPNSVYHSLMACKDLKKVHSCDKLMLVGTTCQLYAAEKALKGLCKEIIKVVIFCKQQKTPEAMSFLAKMNRLKLPLDGKFNLSYRGDGWTGYTTMMGKKLPYKTFSYLPFGRRLWTVPGCNVCGDPYGVEINADIAILDPRK